MQAQVYWQAKIWGLLHDPALKALHNNTGRGGEGLWQQLDCMTDWVSPKAKSLTASPYSSKWLKRIGLCDLIASASDRAAIGRLQKTVDYDDDGIEIKHLLSGESQKFKLGNWHQRLMESDRAEWLKDVETILIPEEIKTCSDPRKVFWWFWRCYPVALSRGLDRDGNNKIPNEPYLPLLPADTRIPDASLWSHTSMTSALAGALAGYYPDADAYPEKRARKGKAYFESRPHVATFSFTPVQELIKASRKMRDFWAGSWLLHYLSAKVCWAIAWKYGPDVLLYPCLYAQPLIDLWLLAKYPDFSDWIETPSERQLLTAGFPNVVVSILPDNGAANSPEKISNPVVATMQMAKQTLLNEWEKLGEDVLADLQNLQIQKKSGEKWQNINLHTWDDWLKSQWQSYWVALPIGNKNAELDCSPRKEEKYKQWETQQNELTMPSEDLLVDAEYKFVLSTCKSAIKEDSKNRRDTRESWKAKQPNLNVGSWWGNIFDQTRFALNAVKNNRTWKLPTAFGTRSTVSGIGPVVHFNNGSENDWISEGETANFWEDNAGLFDGIEQLNATEVLKRGLHRILPNILETETTKLKQLNLYYPDLSSGVAGWLKNNPEKVDCYQEVCQKIIENFPWANEAANLSWGLPWVVDNPNNYPKWFNPRLLNAGWLIEDFEPKSEDTNQVLTKQEKGEITKRELGKVREFISKYFTPGNNPTDWYILAAGDGDGMGDWLKGKYLDNYSEYIPEKLENNIDKLPEEMQRCFREFLKQKKRMGPSTHSALSRALLDFSNQLVPYLTEQRYAGRLIYGGGDDVLAYTNLWEWDDWLWDIRQCFKGAEDPKQEFSNNGDYWHFNLPNLPNNLSERPLFTMGKNATISFGIVIAHHSVPMAIALENLWEAEEKAKEHTYITNQEKKQKDAVQVRVIYGNGNILKATAKFDVFNSWKQMLNDISVEPAIFEQAAQVWMQHPAPVYDAIAPWSQTFCSRREKLSNDENQPDIFQEKLSAFIQTLWDKTLDKDVTEEVKNWLKLAAFVLRQRDIKIKKIGDL